MMIKLRQEPNHEEQLLPLSVVEDAREPEAPSFTVSLTPAQLQLLFNEHRKTTVIIAGVIASIVTTAITTGYTIAGAHSFIDKIDGVRLIEKQEIKTHKECSVSMKTAGNQKAHNRSKK